ncbi:hypothetical protein EXN66_Car021846 [Channa argus]|uniref:Uncharacterized protein n=1 Tax=Channa argus TaxID=215402 RepID=A0A6G1QUI2_CHAAH|nr:hypothetical protein EXN66_Car021846 [Channa argus]
MKITCHHVSMHIGQTSWDLLIYLAASLQPNGKLLHLIWSVYMQTQHLEGKRRVLESTLTQNVKAACQLDLATCVQLAALFWCCRDEQMF